MQDINKISEEKAFILGVLCGDGYISNRVMTLLSKDREFVEYFKRCIIKVYGKVNNKIHLYRNKKYPQNKYYVISFTKQSILGDFSKNFKTAYWRIPEIILNSNNNKIISSFLKAFFDSEASCSFNSSRGVHRRIYCSSTNKNGLLQIIILLKKLNITNIKLYTQKRERIRDKHYIALTTYNSIKQYYNSVGFIIKRKQENLEKCVFSRTFKTRNRDYYFRAIRLKKQRYSNSEIYKKLNIPSGTVYNWFNRGFKPLGCEV